MSNNKIFYCEFCERNIKKSHLFYHFNTFECKRNKIYFERKKLSKLKMELNLL
jgi:hypothetical protein